MIRRAQDRIGLDPEGRVAFKVADASDLPYEDESFDLVAQLNMPPVLRRDRARPAPGRLRGRRRQLGTATPFYTPDSVLRRGFRRPASRRSRRGGVGRRHLLRRPRPPDARPQLDSPDQRRPTPPAARQPSLGGGRDAEAAARGRARARPPGVEYRVVRTESLEHGVSEATRRGRRGRGPGRDERRRPGRPGRRRARGHRTRDGNHPRRPRQRPRARPRHPRRAGRGGRRARRRATSARSTSARPTGSRFLCIASCGFDSDANRIANEARLVKGNLVYAYAAFGHWPPGSPPRSRS